MICHGNRDCNLNGKHCVQCMINEQEYQNLVTHASTKLAEAVIRLAAEHSFSIEEIFNVRLTAYDPEAGIIYLEEYRIEDEEVLLSEQARLAVNNYIATERGPLIRSVYGESEPHGLPLFVLPAAGTVRRLHMKDLKRMILKTVRNAGFGRRWLTVRIGRHFFFACRKNIDWINLLIYLKRHPNYWML